MVRQYIGARYVPKFFENSSHGTDWESGVAYEPLTIVTYGGNSYTSKKPVPSNVGDPANNPTYWAATGIMNEQISKILDELIRINSETINVIFPPLRLVDGVYTVGSCQVLYTYDGHATIIDMGTYSSFSTIKTALENVGITTIDNVIITHWHGDHHGANYTPDHANGYNHWKSAFDMTNTVFYVPEFPTAYDDNSDDYLYKSFINNTINVVTSNGVLFNWKGVEFSVYNVSADDFSYYDNNTSDYNDYCMIVYADFNSVRMCNTADIGVIGQARCVSQGYCKQSDVVTAPHHGINSDGNPEFADIIRARYVYISNAAEGYGNALRDPFFKTAVRYGEFFDNVTNINRGVTFNIDKTGLSVTGNKIVYTSYTEAKIPTLFVDPSINHFIEQNGTESKPFAFIRRALSACKGCCVINLKSDTAETLVIQGAQDTVIIEGNNHNIGYITLLNCANVIIRNATLAGLAVTDSKIYINTVTVEQTVYVTRSMFTCDSLAIAGDYTALSGNKSFCVIGGVSTPNRTAEHNLFSFVDSYATGNFALGQVGGVDTHISCTRSFVDFGRLSDATAILTSVWDNNNPPLIVYDTTANKYGRINSNGTISYVGMT